MTGLRFLIKASETLKVTRAYVLTFQVSKSSFLYKHYLNCFNAYQLNRLEVYILHLSNSGTLQRKQPQHLLESTTTFTPVPGDKKCCLQTIGSQKIGSIQLLLRQRARYFPCLVRVNGGLVTFLECLKTRTKTMTQSINVHDSVQKLISQLDRVVIGYADVKELSIAAFLTDQHVLLEGMPGTAKSLFVVCFQHIISDSSCARLQMTPDIKPMDIVGFEVYNPGTGAFEVRKGPIHSQHFVLVDEINRTPGKTLSALLSSMQERKIYIAGAEFDLPELYFVMATQNPIEQEGVYPLPEAQLDRFGMKINVGYASHDDEMSILGNDALETRNPESILEPVITVEEVLAIREHLKGNIFVSQPAKNYILELNRATRPCHEEHRKVASRDSNFEGMVAAGCSMRAAMAMQTLSRAIAAFNGRNFVLPEDIQKVAPSVMRHRTVTSFEAQAEGKTVDDAMKIIMDNVDFHANKDDYAPSV